MRELVHLETTAPNSTHDGGIVDDLVWYLLLSRSQYEVSVCGGAGRGRQRSSEEMGGVRENTEMSLKMRRSMNSRVARLPTLADHPQRGKPRLVLLPHPGSHLCIDQSNLLVSALLRWDAPARCSTVSLSATITSRP